MASEEKPVTSQTGDEFPDRNFPVVFADGVWSMAHGSGHVKFYLFRLDPSIPGIGTTSPMPFAQVVMPLNGFAAMTVFFRKQMELLVKNGQLTQKEVDDIEAAFSEKAK